MSDEREPLVSPVFDGPVTGGQGWDTEAARSRSAGLPSVSRDNSRFQGPRSQSVSALHIGNDVTFTKRDFRNRRNDSTSATLAARAPYWGRSLCFAGAGQFTKKSGPGSR